MREMRQHAGIENILTRHYVGLDGQSHDSQQGMVQRMVTTKAIPVLAFSYQLRETKVVSYERSTLKGI